MTYTKCWYKSADKNHLGKWKEIPSQMEDERLILCDPIRNRILCPVHCQWEEYKQEGEFDLICSRGKKSHGIIVPYYFDSENPKADPENNGVIILSNPRKTKAPSIDAGSQTEDYTSVFLIFLEVNIDESTALIRERYIDSEKFSLLKDGNLTLTRIPEKRTVNSLFFHGKDNSHFFYSGKKVKIFAYTKGCYYYAGEKMPDYPECISEEMEVAAQKLLESYAGKKIRINKNYYRGFSLLLALAHYPYEANIFDFYELFYSLGEETFLNRDNPDIYNEFCSKLGITSFPKLRKIFEKCPHALLWYKDLLNMGFHDINIILDILSVCCKTFFEEKIYRPSYNKRMDMILYGDSNISLVNNGTTFINNLGIPRLDGQREDHNYFEFFCRYSIPKRGERATWNALNREPQLDSRDREDTARLFEDYFTELKDEEKEMVLKNGFTRRNHDMLSKIAHNIENSNRVFTYTPEQKALEDEIDGYKFLLPVDSDTLHYVGSTMHNCVYSYTSRVLQNQTTIVYAVLDENCEICIEVSKNKKILQSRSDYNGSLKGPAKIAFIKWCGKHGLS
ncbi:MAG: PcfJ domain-containing protein [Treponema sp.]|nr:PcfJ domain-containing protein [Treponema sp.]